MKEVTPTLALRIAVLFISAICLCVTIEVLGLLLCAMGNGIKSYAIHGKGFDLLHGNLDLI